MTGRHSTRTHVCDEVTVWDTGTKQFMTYNVQILHKGRLQPVVRMALGSLVALGIAVTMFGSVAQIPAEPAPTIVTSTAAAVIQAPVVEPAVAEPLLLTPALPPRQHLQRRRVITVARPLPTRVYPLVKQPVVDLPKAGKRHHDKAQNTD